MYVVSMLEAKDTVVFKNLQYHVHEVQPLAAFCMKQHS